MEFTRAQGFWRLRVTWVALVVLTVGSFALAEVGHGAARSLVAAIAFVKTAVIGAVFMELRDAPRGLQAVFAAWVVVTWVVLEFVFWTT